MTKEIPTVALINGNDRSTNIVRCMQTISEQSISSSKGPIILKPNFLSIYNKFASTHPKSIEAVLSFIRQRYNGIIYIVEGSHVAAKAFRSLGIHEMAKKYNAQCFCIDTDETQWVTVDTISLSGTLTKTRLSKLVADAGMRISLTIPKTHGNIGISLTLKNMVGVVHPEDRKLIHGLSEDTSKEMLHFSRRRIYDRDDLIGMITAKIRGKVRRNFSSIYEETNYAFINKSSFVLNRNLASLSNVVSPDLSIIDGFIGMEGEGPWHGSKVNMKLAIASMNYVAADIVGCTVMGFREEALGYKQYLTNTDKKTISLDSINVIGKSINECCYSFIPHSNFKIWR